MGNTNRMNATSVTFGTNRNIMTSQYTNRKLLASQGVHKRCKKSAYMNFMSPDSKFFSDYSPSESATGSAVSVVLPKKAQKLKYTMDKLKLTCNKTTFMKFYELKSKATNLQKLFGNITNIKSRIWKPQVREEWTLDIITNENGEPKGYLINGFNGDGIKQIVQLDIIKKPKPMLDWKTITVSDFDKMHSKFGQATWVDGQFIYISGGAEACLKHQIDDENENGVRKVLSNKKLNISRQCTSELVKFDTVKKQISLLPRGDYIVSPKRDHCIAKFGKYIIAFGGINDLGRVLDDLEIYNTKEGYWEPLEVKNAIEGVWYSSIASIFYPDRFDENKDKLEIDNIPSPNWGRVEHFIKEEGIYVFGGRNRNSEINNSLYILKLGNKTNYWQEAKTLGKGPCHRYQHAMVHLSSKNLLIIHGGRTSQNIKNYSEKRFQSFLVNNDKEELETQTPIVERTSVKGSFTLGDMFALKLDNLEWIKVLLPVNTELARTNHWLSKINDDTLLIFGKYPIL